MFPNIFRTFPKISKDIRRLLKITEEDPKRCFDLISIHFGSFSIETRQTCLEMFEIDISTCEDNMLDMIFISERNPGILI